MAPTATPVRDRILEAATRHYYAEGIRAVSADRLIAEADRLLRRRAEVVDQHRDVGLRPEQLVQDRANLPMQNMQQQELAALIQLALEGLNERQRVAVVLTAILDYSAEEAGRMLGIRASSVRSLTTRARARMKNEVVDPT